MRAFTFLDAAASRLTTLSLLGRVRVGIVAVGRVAVGCVAVAEEAAVPVAA